MGKTVKFGETMVRVITPQELDDAAANVAKEDAERIVNCQRCDSVLFDGTTDKLVSMVTAWKRSAKVEDENLYGCVEFKCKNEGFVDPREPRRTTIVNEAGEKETVAVARLKGCAQRVTVCVKKPK